MYIVVPVVHVGKLFMEFDLEIDSNRLCGLYSELHRFKGKAEYILDLIIFQRH